MKQTQINALKKIDFLIDEIDELLPQLELLSSQRRSLTAALSSLWCKIEAASEGSDTLKAQIAEVERWGFTKRDVDKWERWAPNGHRELWVPSHPNLIRIYNRNLTPVSEFNIDWSLHTK